jgi:hypothetical protein
MKPQTRARKALPLPPQSKQAGIGSTPIFAALAALVAFGLQVSVALAQPTTFTYQGRLSDGPFPANGYYDLTFALYDDLAAGNLIAGPLTNSATAVSNGLFTAALDFGPSVFTGSNYWLEISVTPSGGGNIVILSPRQQIHSAPYALHAGTASNLLGVIPNGSLPANPQFTGAVTATNFIGSGAGLTNVPGALFWQIISGTNQGFSNTGYLVASNAQAAILLPTNAVAGDVIRVSGTPTDGWKILQSTGQVVKSSGAPFSRYSVWTNHGNNLSWGSIASSSDGTKLVAWGSGALYTSPDSGTTWILRTNVGTTYNVASSADGTKLVAVGSSGSSILTSADSGASWTAQIPPIFTTWRSVASSADGTKLVILPMGGQIYNSPDSGVSWIPRTPSASWYGVASSADGVRLIAAGSSGIYTSTNSAVTWTLRISLFLNALSSGGPYVASSSDGVKLVAAVRNGVIFTSTDAGLTWIGQNSGSRLWTAVASSSDGTRLIAAENGITGGSGTIYTSQDSGVTWIAQNSGARNWTSLAASADGTKLVATVSGGFVYTSQQMNASSTSLGAAGYLVGAQSAAIELLHVGNGQFVPLSHEGSIVAY